MSNRTLILYAGKYGCTEKAAFLLKSRLGEAEAVNLKYAKVPALAAYDTVILGSSIYYGKIRKEMAAFTSKYGQELSGKRLGLFICAGMTGEKAEQELQQAYPEVLYKKALAKEILGDEIYPERISALDKWVLRMVKGKGNEAGAGLSMNKLEGFARAMTVS
ncbi:flavodoxin domain-containing protein [Paenibacillus sp. IHB B 3415]|uniref:flavodoxin domain-containing protein n=1 Tax=Paenibacillus sp. IHB B 3415 TaxID=867080 RepID=UPI00069BF5B8|nr:flavodoxin domain-containing protein [Paenibacillus sp. IHB B 3415]